MKSDSTLTTRLGGCLITRGFGSSLEMKFLVLALSIDLGLASIESYGALGCSVKIRALRVPDCGLGTGL